MTDHRWFQVPHTERPVRASTRVAAIIGSPVAHSLSPAMHNRAFAFCGLDWVYVAFDVPAGEAAGALDAARTLGLAGLSVTMPHKTDVAALVDEPSPTVTTLAAANTVVVASDRTLRGENTDGAGFVDGLRHDHDICVDGMSAVVIGAGGAGRAIVLALAEAGCQEVVVVNRSAERGEAAAALAGRAGRVGTAADIPAASLVVNALPPSANLCGGPPFDPDLLRPGQVVADLVYRPRVTTLLQEALRRGCRPVDGLGMLVHQGARQFELWTGVPAPRSEMRDAVEAALPH